MLDRFRSGTLQIQFYEGIRVSSLSAGEIVPGIGLAADGEGRCVLRRVGKGADPPKFPALLLLIHVLGDKINNVDLLNELFYVHLRSLSVKSERFVRGVLFCLLVEDVVAVKEHVDVFSRRVLHTVAVENDTELLVSAFRAVLFDLVFCFFGNHDNGS